MTAIWAIEAWAATYGDVVNVAGIILQVVGVAVAIGGVFRLHRDLTSRSIGAAMRADIVERWEAWRNRKNVVVKATSATIGVTSNMAGVGTVTDEALPDDPAEQIRFLHRKVKALKDLIDSEHRWNDGQHAQLRSESNTTAERLSGEIAEVERLVGETRHALAGGPAGEGLRWAAGGLAVTILGLLLTLVAAV